MIGSEFTSWQVRPPPADHTGPSPALVALRAYMLERWLGFSDLGCYGRRAVRGGEVPSSHSYGAAVDIGYPIGAQQLVVHEVCPWLVAYSRELGLQAIHDYRRSRIWRAGRTALESQACDTWWKAQRHSASTGMGQLWTNHLHLEVTPQGWSDPTPIEVRIAAT